MAVTSRRRSRSLVASIVRPSYPARHMLRCCLPAVFVFLVFSSADATADTYPRQPGVDAIHYVFRLTITDASNEIGGEGTATLRMVADGVREVFLDLASAADGRGMT